MGHLVRLLVRRHKMSVFVEIIKQFDFFSHNQLLRYRGQQNYRTIFGGIVSSVLLILFVCLFSSLFINTFRNRIITSQQQLIYQLDPSQYELQIGSNSKFLFAVGIINLNLSSQKRYFDFQFVLQSTQKTMNNGSTYQESNKTYLMLSPCKLDDWSQINQNIQNSFIKMGLDEWLCLSPGSILPLAGRYSSDLFKYGKLSVLTCANNTDCASDDEISEYLRANEGVITINLYFVNPVINPNQQKYIDFYFQDLNYFKANPLQGVEANLFFSQYTIQTDQSLMPWADVVSENGSVVEAIALPNYYPTQANINGIKTFAQIFFRKSASKKVFERGSQKLDETLSYIGGLFGITVILFSFITQYDKFAYQIQFGDRIFKQDTNGSYGSQNFNFIVYIGYGIYNILRILGWKVGWETMKKYHECRLESVRQLDIHYLFKKIGFLEEVSKIILEEHHLKGINLLSKPTIQDIKIARKRFQLQSIIYHQLERKGRGVLVEKAEYSEKLRTFLQKDTIQASIAREIGLEEQQHSYQLQEIAKSYKKLSQDFEMGDVYSKKILNRLQINDVCNAIIGYTLKQPQTSPEMLGAVTNDRLTEPLQLFFICGERKKGDSPSREKSDFN